jgi:hypothetical protein
MQHRGEPKSPPPPPPETPEPAPKKELPGQGNKVEKKDTSRDPKETSKEGFNAKQAADLTTQSRIDAVKAASETTKL